MSDNSIWTVVVPRTIRYFKAKSFCGRLKDYSAAEINPQFAGLHFIAAATFAPGASSFAIHDPKEGIVWISEVAELIRKHRDDRFAQRPSEWMKRGLNQVPSPDALITPKGDRLHGFVDPWPMRAATDAGNEAARASERSLGDAQREQEAERNRPIVEAAAGRRVLESAGRRWCSGRNARRATNESANQERGAAVRRSSVRGASPRHVFGWLRLGGSERAPLAGRARLSGRGRRVRGVPSPGLAQRSALRQHGSTGQAVL